MTFYQELQLSSTGSKQLIKTQQTKRKNKTHFNLQFQSIFSCGILFLVVTAFSMIFGNDNSVPGVVVLLAILVLRQADFGIKTTHGLISIAGIFAILIVGPRLSNMVDPLTAFIINIVCIFLLMMFGCHNVIMYNHSTFVLGYLLLQGYDVAGKSYQLRVVSLVVGMLICMGVFIKIRKTDLIKEVLWIFLENSIYTLLEITGI